MHYFFPTDRVTDRQSDKEIRRNLGGIDILQHVYNI